MSLTLLTDATRTGGTPVALSQAGVSPGKSVYVGPSMSRLEIQRVEFTSSQSDPTQTSLGTARSGMKITFGDREVSAGCCTVKQGSVILDLGLRWDLSQPQGDVENIIEWLRGLVYTAAFENLLLKGLVPTA